MDSKCCSEKTSHRLPRHSSLGDGRKGKTFLEGVEEEKFEKIKIAEAEEEFGKIKSAGRVRKDYVCLQKRVFEEGSSSVM